MSSVPSHGRFRFLQYLLLACLVAGTLDLAAAIASNLPRGIAPLSIMQSIASGLLGRDAYRGGIATAALGVSLHFAIMFVIATSYFVASRYWPLLQRRPLLAGPLYGVLVYGVMNLVVLPLSAFPHALSFAPSRLATGLAIHMLLVGLPIAWIASRCTPGSRE